MSKTLDDKTRATNPAGLTISRNKLRRLLPDLYGFRALIVRMGLRLNGDVPVLVYIKEHLQHGDSRAAVVLSIDPLLVAAYTDEFDCVAVLRFATDLAEEYSLRVGQRLLAVNTYKNLQARDPDLDFGPKMIPRWSGFYPIIADFISDDLEIIAARKDEIGNEEFERALAMGKSYLVKHPGLARDGRPVFASRPAISRA